MGFPFTDITLYLSHPYKVSTPEYDAHASFLNYISDLYWVNLNGYKPPKTSRVSVTELHGGQRTAKVGSIAAVAPKFNFDEFIVLSKPMKCKYILDVIQNCMMELCDAYHWNKEVFNKAYQQVLASDFKYRKVYPPKKSRDRKKSASFVIEKTEAITSLFVEIDVGRNLIRRKLLDKKNWWCFDCCYFIAKYSKWFDNDRFGIGTSKKVVEIWYSIKHDRVTLTEDGNEVQQIDFSKYFWLG